jgi:hypothetical protein
MSPRPSMLAALRMLLLAGLILPLALSAGAAHSSFYAMLGCRTVELEHLPLLTANGRDYA